MAPSVWGDGALTELLEPTITVRVNGVAPESLPTARLRPGGVDSKRSSTVRGSSRTDSVSVRPLASVAVSLSTRWDGNSWSGAANEPEATPAKSWIWCVWQFCGS